MKNHSNIVRLLLSTTVKGMTCKMCALMLLLLGTTSVRAAVGDTLKGVTQEGDTFVVVITDEVAKTAQIGTGSEACMADVAHTVTLPATVEGYRLTTVGNKAFQALTNITRVVLPEGIDTIGEESFAYTYAMAEIVLPNSLRSIKNNAFYMAGGLTSLTLPEGLQSIGGAAVYNCAKLKNVTLPTTLTKVDNSAFSQNKALEEVVFRSPSQLDTIPSWMFGHCAELKKVTLPANLKVIEGFAFASCGKLYDINWTATALEDIGAATFSGCAFRSITLPATMKIVNSNAFQDNFELTSITSLAPTPPAVTQWSFAGHWEKCSVVVPKGTLQTYANSGWGQFAHLSEMEDLAPDATFEGFTIDGTAMTCRVQDADARTCVIGDGTQPAIQATVGNILRLPAVTKGYTIVGIAANAFSNQTALQQVVTKSTTPADLAANAFATDVYTSATLYVPMDAKPAYQSHAQWARFAKMGEDIAAGRAFFADSPEQQTLRFRVVDDVQRTCEVWGGLSDPPMDDKYTGALTVPALINGHTVVGVTEYGFAGCRFSSITLPETITYLGKSCFFLCRYLQQANIPGKVTVLPRALFSICEKLSRIDIPEGVTTIEAGAFERTGLEYVVLPASVTELGGTDGKVFDQVRLNYIVVRGDLPEAVNTNNFSYYDKTRLRVDADKVEACRQAEVWKEFATIDGTADGIPVTQQYFPDAGLRDGLQSLYGDVISVDEEEQTTTLDLSNRNIADVTPLTQYFANLRELHVENNRLSALHLGKKALLEHVYAQHNEMDTIGWDSIPNLKTINVSYNRLKGLYFNDTPKITKIEATNNQLSTLEMTKAVLIDTLNVANNNLSGWKAGLNVFKELLYFNVDNNNFTTFGVAANKLKTLSCRYNMIDHIANISLNNPNLENLYCDNNLMTSLGISNMSRLKEVSCSHNKLQVLEMSNNNALTHLDCSYNRIIYFTLSNLPKLQQLNFSRNSISEFNPSNFAALRSLSCSDNSLKTLNTAGNTMLEELYCQGNLLTGLNLQANTKLTALNAAVNNITSLSTQGLTDLAMLNMSNNLLSQLSLTDNTALKQLYLDRNSLWQLDLSHNPLLEALTLSYNSIPSINLAANTAITDAELTDLTNQQVKGALIMVRPNELGLLVPDDTQLDNVEEVLVGGQQVQPTEIITYKNERYLVVPVANPASAGKVVQYKYNPQLPNLPEKRLEVKYSIMELTGIDTINVNGNENAHWFTLDGRSVSTPTQPGIYILNGKKVVIK